MDIFKKTQGLKLVKFLKRFGFYPFFREIEATDGTSVTFQGSEMIMMGSNNYLGLSHHPRVIKASQEAIETWGTGCTGSRFLNGNLQIHAELEKLLAEFLGYEKTLVFATGFMANQGAIQALAAEGDFIFSDSENHACIVEGCRLAKGQTVIYRNHDMNDLEKKLQSVPKKAGKIIITDGVFSMNGSIAKLDQIQKLAKKYNARTYVDDAHALGTIGKGGRGTSSHWNIKPDIIMGTFSKSLASQGGFIAGSQDVIDWIKQKGKTFMFSAALSPASTAAALESLKVLMEKPEMVKEASNKADYLKEKLTNLGLDLMNTQANIIPIFVGSDKKALKLSNDLLKHNIFVTPVVFPAVPQGQALIRCSVMANHSYEELDKTVEAFSHFAEEIIMENDEKKIPLHTLLNTSLNDNQLSEISEITERYQ